jgi:c-di-GMP-binding flagellar brake protein YcgR
VGDIRICATFVAFLQQQLKMQIRNFGSGGMKVVLQRGKERQHHLQQLTQYIASFE